MREPCSSVHGADTVVSRNGFHVSWGFSNDVDTFAEDLESSRVSMRVVAAPCQDRIWVNSLVYPHLPEHRCSVRRPIAAGIHILSAGRVVIERQVGIG